MIVSPLAKSPSGMSQSQMAATLSARQGERKQPRVPTPSGVAARNGNSTKLTRRVTCGIGFQWTHSNAPGTPGGISFQARTCLILPKSRVPGTRGLTSGGAAGHKTGMETLDELRALIVRHARPGVRDTALPGVRVTARSNPTELVHGVYEPAFALVAQGAKCTLLADQVFEYGVGQYLIVSLDLPVSGRVTKARSGTPFLGFGFTLKPDAIATLLLEAAVGDHSDAASLGMAVSDAGRDLLEAVVRLLRLLDQPTDIPVLRPMIEREILWRLLAGEQGALVRQVGLADGRLSQIGHAIRWIRQHFAETLRIEDLAARAAMSVSSFHRHFKAATAMSPLQYQKQIRLQAARARLMVRPEDVAAVGFGVGYDSPSQFSREYARLFGMPPGRDAARLRQLPPPDAGWV